jgi:hypothetical protein
MLIYILYLCIRPADRLKFPGEEALDASQGATVHKSIMLDLPV